LKEEIPIVEFLDRVGIIDNCCGKPSAIEGNPESEFSQSFKTIFQSCTNLALVRGTKCVIDRKRIVYINTPVFILGLHKMDSKKEEHNEKDILHGS
jgi:hypothetical protein